VIGPKKAADPGRRLRFAAILVVLGLVIELVSLRWAHPTAFIVFAAGTGAFAGIGILIALVVLLGNGPRERRMDS
jgi:hypothetical protein